MAATALRIAHLFTCLAGAAGPLMLALMSYAFALLTVECVLVDPQSGAKGSVR
jgi:hypothetical protein